MDLSLRKTTIQNLDFVLSSCPTHEEDMVVAYTFVKELFRRVCSRSLLFCNNKYNICDYPFLYSERQLDSLVLPVISELCKGIVIAEYPVVRKSNLKGYEKEDSKGWIDYWCIYKDYSFVIEMKHSYDAFRTNNTKDDSLIKKWEKMTIGQLQDIRSQVKYFEERTRGLIRIGLHFITPYSGHDGGLAYVDFFESKQKEILKRLYDDVSRSKPTKTSPSFLASWVLPKNDRYFEVPYKGIVPGLMLLGKMYSAIEHDGFSLI